LKVLGLVSNTHDSGCALVDGGEIVAVLEEERFNRIKRTRAFPAQSLEHLFDTGLRPADLGAIVTPWDERKLRNFVIKSILRRFPASLNLMHARAHPVQRNQIVVLSSYLRRGLAPFWAGKTVPPIVSVGHHDAHAASFFVSPFEQALVVVMDGYGDDASASVYVGRGNRLERVWSTPIFNSLGLVYTVVTGHLGFEGFGDEGKVMALAAYGTDALVEAFRDCVRPSDDGYRVDMSYFNYDAYGQINPFRAKFIDHFGPARKPGAPLTQRDYDLAKALQVVSEEIILHLVRQQLLRYPHRHIVMTGGVALNCVANARVLQETGIERLWVPPCASDTGAPLGAALWHTHQTLGHRRVMELTHPFYGAEYKPEAIAAALSDAGLQPRRLPERELIASTARQLADGKIVGWFQGRFEMGPRALGNRSILADPRAAAMRDKLNARIKKREAFRPFAPAVPVERAAEFFELTQPDPFMTLAPRVRPEKQHLLPAAVHIDGTGRIQTVEARANPRYHALLTEFGRLTGVPVLINTSFNEQEPIVARPAEAIACFLRTQMDVLVIGDFIAVKAAGVRATPASNDDEDRAAAPTAAE
jgi:carbamoyltransferase